MKKSIKTLRRVLSFVAFQASMLCVIISHRLDPEVGALGMEAIRAGLQSKSMTEEGETCDCDRSVIHDCACPYCRQRYLRTNPCAKFHRGPFIRTPNGMTRCVECKTDLAPSQQELLACARCYEPRVRDGFILKACAHCGDPEIDLRTP